MHCASLSLQSSCSDSRPRTLVLRFLSVGFQIPSFAFCHSSSSSSSWKSVHSPHTPAQSSSLIPPILAVWFAPALTPHSIASCPLSPPPPPDSVFLFSLLCSVAFNSSRPLCAEWLMAPRCVAVRGRKKMKYTKRERGSELDGGDIEGQRYQILPDADRPGARTTWTSVTDSQRRGRETTGEGAEEEEETER